MYNNVSNKVLASIAVVALFVTVMGTLLSINRITGEGHLAIIGYAVTNETGGNVSFTINDINWINFSQSRCSWGSGYARKTCKLNTSPYINASGCSSGFTTTNCAPLQIKNIGNNNCSLNITFKNSSAFIGGANAKISYKLQNGTGTTNTLPGCTLSTNFSRFVTANWVKVTKTYYSNITCDKFYYGVNQNTITLQVQVEFDAAATTGFRINKIIATGKPKI
ncbi:MAG: hypothetical protein V1837_03140 [Candidatus Woesearchaeota archaeon]